MAICAGVGDFWTLLGWEGMITSFVWGIKMHGADRYNFLLDSCPSLWPRNPIQGLWPSTSRVRSKETPEFRSGSDSFRYRVY